MTLFQSIMLILILRFVQSSRFEYRWLTLEIHIVINAYYYIWIFTVIHCFLSCHLISITMPDSPRSESLQDFEFHPCSWNTIKEMIGVVAFVPLSKGELHLPNEAFLKDEIHCHVLQKVHFSQRLHFENSHPFKLLEMLIAIPKIFDISNNSTSNKVFHFIKCLTKSTSTNVNIHYIGNIEGE